MALYPENRFYQLSRFCASFVLTFCTLLLSSCGEDTPDEDRIQQAIDEIVKAVETNSLEIIEDYLHKDFSANGEMDARQVKQLILAHKLRKQNIGINVLKNKTSLDEVYIDQAHSSLSVLMTGGGRLPNDGAYRNVKLDWMKEDGDWKILRAEWKN
jgi:hypothetical protein